jgi:hypothetical protein
LSHGVQVAGAACHTAMRIAQIGYSVIGRSRVQVVRCAIYTVHVETRSASFLVEPQN